MSVDNSLAVCSGFFGRFELLFCFFTLFSYHSELPCCCGFCTAPNTGDFIAGGSSLDETLEAKSDGIFLSGVLTLDSLFSLSSDDFDLGGVCGTTLAGGGTLPETVRMD